jgi:hypothetical protein
MEIRVLERLNKFMLCTCFPSLSIILVSAGPEPKMLFNINLVTAATKPFKLLSFPQISAEKSWWLASLIIAVF